MRCAAALHNRDPVFDYKHNLQTYHSMKKPITLTALLSAALVFAACSDDTKAEQLADNVADSTQKAYQKSMDALGDGWDSVKDFTFEQKTKFSSTMNSMGNELEAKYYKLKANSSDLSSEAKAKVETAMEKFKNSMSKLSAATADTWEEAKEETREAWDNLQDAYRDATN